MNLILANNLKDGNAVINAYDLDHDDCAIITEPSHMEFVTLNSNETVYAHTSTNLELINELANKINQMRKNASLTIKITNPL
jgi:hypothetical protein